MDELLDQKSIHIPDDPEWIDDIRDPLRAAAGILRMTVIAIIFWSLLIGIVWLANTYL